MRRNRGTNSRAEVALRSELHRRGLRFRKNVSVVPGLRCRPDIVFPRWRVAVFVDGCFWHGCPEHGTTPRVHADYWASKIGLNKLRDREQTESLIAVGWSVIRVWEHSAPACAADLIATELAARRRAAQAG
jgi:DNA mismatch endonuclease (patch repair protein)